jgi:hypothetical protein
MVSQRETPSEHFQSALQAEVDRALADRIFQRSPVQRRLLQFLAGLAMDGAAPPTQFQIAVDGLGKSPDFDLVNDSYPRVQVSRLRSNLENFYARSPREDGVRLVLQPGEYQIDLEQPALKKAHPAVGSEEQPTVQAPEPDASLPKPPLAAPRRLVLATMLIAGISAGSLTAHYLIKQDHADNGDTGVQPVKVERPLIVVDASTQGLGAVDDNQQAVVQSAMQAAKNQLA